jgi:hypothetical protein
MRALYSISQSKIKTALENAVSTPFLGIIILIYMPTEPHIPHGLG